MVRDTQGQAVDSVCAHAHMHTPSHLESGEADVLIHTAGSGQPVLKTSQTYKYALFFLMIEKIKAPDSSVSKCYLSEHTKMFPRLSTTDTSGGMIIAVDASLKGSHYDWLWPDEGGGGCFFYSSYSHRKETNNTS